MPIDAPLHFGQLSTWRSIETFAADRLMEVNVPDCWDVTGLDEARILHALRCLTERHEALRTTFHTAGEVPFQRVHARLEPRIEWFEAPDAEAGTVTAALRSLHARAFPVTDDPGWRVVLLRVDGRPRRLLVSLSHMVVDVWAVRQLEFEFRAFATGGVPGGGPAARPRDLAAAQSGDGWATRRRGARKYWNRLLDGGPGRNLPVPPARTEQCRIQATLRSHRLAQLTGEAAKMHGVSPQSVLTAMTAAALASVVWRDRVVLSVMCANRFDPRWQSIVSTMNQLVPLVCATGPGTALGAHLKRVHLGALLAYRHGCYDVDMAAELAELPSGGAPFAHDCWFNYVTGPDAPPSGPGGTPPATFAWTPPPRHAGHPFYVRVNGDGDTSTEITLRADPDLLPAEAVVTALRTMVLGVRRAVTAPDSTLGELADATDDPSSAFLGAELDACLFPSEVPGAPRVDRGERASRPPGALQLAPR
ncbi:condensation domain-containing protein [Streptantibioticus parmotrematis]|uniref:condensation domain-containing protein n=1 Tax=Streptantibioticus parmotrematis TaxID=2873249 RepID=UPI0033FB969E